MRFTEDGLRQRIADEGLLLDGGLGTELERRGVRGTLPLWSTHALLERPQLVRTIHGEYVEAGAGIVVAGTFRTNPRALRAAGLGGRGAELNRLAVDLAREAVGERVVLVGASVAPVADCYDVERVPDEQTLSDEHAENMDWVAGAEPDLVWIETMGTLREAVAACRAARERGLPFVISLMPAERGTLLSGEPLAEVVAAVEEEKPMAIGMNCAPPLGISSLLPTLLRLSSVPTVAYAHIGNREPTTGWSFSEANVEPEQYAEYAGRWCALGVRVIGGCCGTRPGHVRAVCERIRGGEGGSVGLSV